MLVQEVLSRLGALCLSPARPPKAGPNGVKRDLARSGNARVRRGMIELACGSFPDLTHR
jgi:hypothetical protein